MSIYKYSTQCFGQAEVCKDEKAREQTLQWMAMNCKENEMHLEIGKEVLIVILFLNVNKFEVDHMYVIYEG